MGPGVQRHRACTAIPAAPLLARPLPPSSLASRWRKQRSHPCACRGLAVHPIPISILSHGWELCAAAGRICVGLGWEEQLLGFLQWGSQIFAPVLFIG